MNFQVILLFIIGLAVGLLAVNVISATVLEATQVTAKDLKLYQGILSVLGFDGNLEGVKQRFRAHVAVLTFPQQGGKDFIVWVGTDEAGEVKGYAIRLRGVGFQGIIDLVVGLTPDLKKTTGMEVIDSGETPGLGDMSTCTDPQDPHLCFKQWFYLGVETEPAVEFVKYKDPEHPNEFRAITGATYTTTAIRDFLNQALGIVRGLYAEGKLAL